MLTARAEYRLRLRADNAATRLGAAAIASGAVGDERRELIEARASQLAVAHAVLERHVFGVTMADRVRQGEDVSDELMFHVEHASPCIL